MQLATVEKVSVAGSDQGEILEMLAGRRSSGQRRQAEQGRTHDVGIARPLAYDATVPLTSDPRIQLLSAIARDSKVGKQQTPVLLFS